MRKVFYVIGTIYFLNELLGDIFEVFDGYCANNFKYDSTKNQLGNYIAVITGSAEKRPKKKHKEKMKIGF